MAGNDIAAPPLSANHLDTHSNRSRFPDVALHKLRSSLFNFTTQANTACEKVTVPVRQFIRPHHQSGRAYRWYGLADALNLSVSLCTLGYTLKHAYQQSSQLLTPQEFQLSLKEFHDAEKTPEGLTLAILFTVFLVGFSVLGSYYDENKDAPWVKDLVFYWPYVRDASKQYKWTGKGEWAAMSLLLQYGFAQQAYLIQLMFPLMLIGGTISAINRIWLRWMRDKRKDMVRSNLDLIEGIKAPLHQLDKLPKSLTGFEYSLIFLQDTKELHYINAFAKSERVVMKEEEWTDFYQQVSELQTANIHARMKQYFCYLYKDNLTPEQINDKTLLRLHFIANQDAMGVRETEEHAVYAINSEYFDSYVYFSQAEEIDDVQRLYYITKEGLLVKQSNSALFHKKYQEVQQDKNVLNLSTTQLKTIGHPIIGTRQLGHSYQEFVKMRHDILANNPDQSKNKIQNQSGWTTWFAPLSAGGSAIGDGLYFYFFVAKMTVSTLSPGMAFFMMSASATLFVTCMVTRIAEEFDFQRRLQVTILRAEAELSKKDCILLHEQLESLLDKEESEVDDNELTTMISALESSMAHRKEQLRLHGIETTQDPIATDTLSQHKKAALLLWNELHDELKLSKGLQDQLRVKLDRSYWAAALEGMQNGLAVQGAISSFSFMVSSLCYVSAAACPPAFIIGCLVVGLAAIILSCLQGCISHYFYLEKVKQTKLELSLEFRGEMLKKMTSENLHVVAATKDDVDKALDYVNNQPLEPPVDFVVIEWSEILRLLCKGLVKGHNSALEFFSRLLENTDSMWMLPIIVVGGTLSFGAALAMRATAKGFAVGRPDSNVNAGDAAGSARKFFDTDKKKNIAQKRVFDSSMSFEVDTTDLDDDGVEREPVTPVGYYASLL